MLGHEETPDTVQTNHDLDFFKETLNTTATINLGGHVLVKWMDTFWQPGSGLPVKGRILPGEPFAHVGILSGWRLFAA